MLTRVVEGFIHVGWFTHVATILKRCQLLCGKRSEQFLDLRSSLWALQQPISSARASYAAAEHLYNVCCLLTAASGAVDLCRSLTTLMVLCPTPRSPSPLLLVAARCPARLPSLRACWTRSMCSSSGKPGVWTILSCIWTYCWFGFPNIALGSIFGQAEPAQGLRYALKGAVVSGVLVRCGPVWVAAKCPARSLSLRACWTRSMCSSLGKC